MITAMSWPTYLQAIELARAEVKAGHAIAYAPGYSHDRGRYVEIETAEGWSHEPFWQEHYPDYEPSDEPYRYY
jgi:hypothetical protein